ncbi:hypothetical protein IKF30_01860 [Candidatus Saccharibacteria bacterium]|nr:hypothetical protein [Candidatus Saccharibacteria bacterium]
MKKSITVIGIIAIIIVLLFVFMINSSISREQLLDKVEETYLQALYDEEPIIYKQVKSVMKLCDSRAINELSEKEREELSDEVYFIVKSYLDYRFETQLDSMD